MRMPAIARALVCATSLLACATVRAQALSADSAFADSCVGTVLDGLEGRTWLLTDGFADSRLVAQARTRGVALVALPLRGGDAPTTAAFEAAAAQLGSPRLAAAAALGPAPFVQTWMRERPDEAAAKLALMVEPSLAKAAGLEPVPSGLVYLLHKPDAVDSNLLARVSARHADWRDSLGEIVAWAPADPGSAAFARWLRAHASSCGNNLGVLLHGAGMKKEALDAFTQAHAIDRGNLSALLNRASLVREGLRPELGESIAAELNALAKAGGGSWTLASSNGYVVKPSDFFEAGWYWTLSGLPLSARETIEAELSAIGDPELRDRAARQLMTSLALQTAGAQPALLALSRMPEAGFTWETLLQFAEMMLATGDRDRALRLVDRASAMRGADPQAVAFARADVLVKTGRPGEAVAALRAVQTPANAPQTLPRIAFAQAAAGDGSGLLATVGALQVLPDAPAWLAPLAASLQAQAKGDRAEAQTLADRALVEGAEADYAFRHALTADMMAGDKAAAGRHAEAALKRFPQDAFANYIQAAILVDRRAYAEAERHFQISIAQSPVWYVFNDYGALAAETGRFDLAERLARSALASGGGEAAAVWDSLGSALRGLKRAPEALEAFKTAIAKEGGDDPRIQLHYAEAAWEAGDAAAARRSLENVDKNLEPLSIAERERLGRLRQAVAPKTK